MKDWVKQFHLNFWKTLKKRFQTSFGTRAKSAHAYAFNADFQVTIKTLTEQANDPRSKTYRQSDRKIDEINTEIENTKNTVLESIDKVLERGEKLELLVHKSDNLTENSIKFNRDTKKLKNRMLWKNIRITLILFFIIALLIYIILGFACGFALNKC